jgi:hypothetical protein
MRTTALTVLLFVGALCGQALGQKKEDPKTPEQEEFICRIVNKAGTDIRVRVLEYYSEPQTEIDKDGNAERIFQGAGERIVGVWDATTRKLLVATTLTIKEHSVILVENDGGGKYKVSARPLEREEAARLGARLKSVASLKALTLAFHEYAIDHGGAMPPAVVRDKKGKPLYSWRVLLLPYLGEKKLSAEFHLDEPWDSEHNKKLLEKIPEVFAPVPGEDRKAFATHYQVFVGPEAPFRETDPTGPRVPATFADGTSYTILVAEGAEAVPWTAPRDLAYDAKKPLPKLGGLVKEGYLLGMADGSVRYFRHGKPSEKTLRAAITPAGGEVLDRDWDSGVPQ